MSGVSVAKKNGGQTSAIFANDTRWRPNSQILHRGDRSNSRVTETARPSGVPPSAARPSGMLLLSSNYIWITYLSTIYPNKSETGVFNLFNETRGKKYSFWPFKAARVKMSIMKIPWFKQYWCLITIFKNNYNKRTQLDTNPRLTLAQTLTLSTGDVVLTILLVGVVTSQWYLLSVTLMHHKIL